MNTRLGLGSKELTQLQQTVLVRVAGRPVSWQMSACTSMVSPKSLTVVAPIY